MKLKQNKIERNKIKEEKRNRWKTIENERKGKERKGKKRNGRGSMSMKVSKKIREYQRGQQKNSDVDVTESNHYRK